jgi:hypothetical protein
MQDSLAGQHSQVCAKWQAYPQLQSDMGQSEPADQKLGFCGALRNFKKLIF